MITRAIDPIKKPVKIVRRTRLVMAAAPTPLSSSVKIRKKWSRRRLSTASITLKKDGLLAGKSASPAFTVTRFDCEPDWVHKKSKSSSAQSKSKDLVQINTITGEAIPVAPALSLDHVETSSSDLGSDLVTIELDNMSVGSESDPGIVHEPLIAKAKITPIKRTKLIIHEPNTPESMAPGAPKIIHKPKSVASSTISTLKDFLENREKYMAANVSHLDLAKPKAVAQSTISSLKGFLAK